MKGRGRNDCSTNPKEVKKTSDKQPEQKKYQKKLREKKDEGDATIESGTISGVGAQREVRNEARLRGKIKRSSHINSREKKTVLY